MIDEMHIVGEVYITGPFGVKEILDKVNKLVKTPEGKEITEGVNKIAPFIEDGKVTVPISWWVPINSPKAYRTDIENFMKKCVELSLEGEGGVEVHFERRSFMVDFNAQGTTIWIEDN